MYLQPLVGCAGDPMTAATTFATAQAGAPPHALASHSLILPAVTELWSHPKGRSFPASSLSSELHKAHGFVHSLYLVPLSALPGSVTKVAAAACHAVPQPSEPTSQAKLPRGWSWDTQLPFERSLCSNLGKQQQVLMHKALSRGTTPPCRQNTCCQLSTPTKTAQPNHCMSSPHNKWAPGGDGGGSGTQ